MKKTVLFIGLATLLSAGSAMAATATPTPCADMAKQVDTALKGAKLNKADTATAQAHLKKAQELCKAKKDADADAEYTAVLGMIKK
jgi:hypothetical protein